MRQLGFNDLRPDPKLSLMELGTKRVPLAILLDHVDDPTNLGSIFRLADAARIEEILIYGGSSSFKRTKKLKTARSTDKYVANRFIDTIDVLKNDEGRRLIALEYTNTSIPYTAFKPNIGDILVLGSESSGISQVVLDACTLSIHIPMLGMNSSMNVACAASVAVYSFLHAMGEI